MPRQEQFLPDVPSAGLDVLQSLAVHHFLTPVQLTALLELSADETGPMLDGLAARRLITRFDATGTVGMPTGSRVVALTRRGAAVLGAATGERVRAPSPHKSLFMLGHDLARNDLAVVLAMLSRRGAITLLRWETARTKLADAAWLRTGGRALRVPLVPDALAVVREGGNLSALIVEIDRGTVSLERMATKFAGYHAWWRMDGPLRRFGISAVRILTLAPNVTRSLRLRQAAQQATGAKAGGLFWFGTQDCVDLTDPSRLLTATWSTAAGATAAALFPDTEPGT